jgi:Secretion system C-terminal sorting domain
MGYFQVKNGSILKILILFSCFIAPLIAQAQKQGSQWCFGDSADIDWTDPENPQFFVSSSEYRGSCASIADTSGNLLFYCANRRPDGLVCENDRFNHIFNKNHEAMENGSCLTGFGWYNEHTIIPYPGSDSLYYVFSVQNWERISYSVVDMSANGGLGKVIERDHQLIGYEEYGSYFVTSITTVKHGNGRDWWVVARSGGGDVQNGTLPLEYYLFLVTPDGVTTTYISSEDECDSNINQLLFNHQGNKFYAICFDGEIQEYNFNRCNGDLTLNRTIDTITYILYNDGDSAYTRAYFFSELSPNDRFLYISTLPFPECWYVKGYLLQLDLWEENPMEHIDTLSIYGPDIDGFEDPMSSGCLRLAPDGKIYFAGGLQSCSNTNYYIPYTDSIYTISNTYLSVINNPDSLGGAANYEEYSFYLGGNRTYLGLPNNPNYNLEPINCDTVISNTREQKSFLKSNFNIFPNPCYYSCILEYKPAKENGSITIATATGKIIFTEQNIPVALLQHGYDVNTTAFAKGVYFVTLISGNQNVTKKLVRL